MDNFNLSERSIEPIGILYWITFNLAELPILEDFYLSWTLYSIDDF